MNINSTDEEIELLMEGIRYLEEQPPSLDIMLRVETLRKCLQIVFLSAYKDRRRRKDISQEEVWSV